MSYAPLDQTGHAQSPTGNPQGPIHFSNTISGPDSGKSTMQDTVYEGFRPSDESDPVQGKPTAQKQNTWNSLFSRTNSGFSNKSWQTKAWEHKLNEKRLRGVATDTDTVRYFDRSRQTRRVFWSCLCMWMVTALICGALAGVLAGFSSLEIITQDQKYAYNACVTGFSILLGLAFAAQFKQYCEMMRWRFLASSYRTIDDFEEVLGCDSWRATLKLIFMGWKKGTFYPAKSQVLAFVWLVIFIAFNVFAALLGLTYSIDVSDTYVDTNKGNVSVVDLSYIATLPQADPETFGIGWQQMAANLYGQSGQSFQWVQEADINNVYQDETPTVFTGNFTQFWYRFVDLNPSISATSSASVNLVTNRTINSTATCEEYRITYGGHAGAEPNTTDSQNYDQYGLAYVDSRNQSQYIVVEEQARGLTTWMSNSSSACGDRCIQLLVLQSANNLTTEEAALQDYVSVQNPRLWACNNTVSQVTNLDQYGFANETRLELPDLQAQIMAGAIGWSGITISDTDGNVDPLQYQIIRGDNGFNLAGNITAEGVSAMLMYFTTTVFAAMDQQGGPRVTMTGDYVPSAAQTINVKWQFAGAILAGLPILQFIMLLAVVWFSRKAIILEPSYLTAAHLLYPVVHKLGPGGILMSVDEMAEKLGSDYKVAYTVRPDANDPGPAATEYVRKLDLVEEKEGYGYIRGQMAEGRYD